MGKDKRMSKTVQVIEVKLKEEVVVDDHFLFLERSRMLPNSSDPFNPDSVMLERVVLPIEPFYTKINGEMIKTQYVAMDVEGIEKEIPFLETFGRLIKEQALRSAEWNVHEFTRLKGEEHRLRFEVNFWKDNADYWVKKYKRNWIVRLSDFITYHLWEKWIFKNK